MSSITLSYSQMASFRACPRKWSYSYQDKLEQTTDSIELDIGSWWHAIRAIDGIEKGTKLGSLKSAPETVSTPLGELETKKITNYQTVLEIIDYWWQRVSEEYTERYHDKIGAQFPRERLEHMNVAWRDRWEEENKSEIPIAVEHRFKRSLELDSHPQVDVSMQGVIDLVYWDTSRNILAIRDYKTSKNLGNESTTELFLDSQLQLYVWGLLPQLKSLGVKDGVIPSLISYDRARTSCPKAPKLTLTGTLSKSVLDYDLFTYLNWAHGEDGKGVAYPGRAKDGSGAGYYQPETGVLDHLKSESSRAVWFTRASSLVNPNVIKEHLLSALDTSELMVDVKEDKRTARRNFGKTCNWCEFSDICKADLMSGSPGKLSPEELSLYGLRKKQYH